MWYKTRQLPRGATGKIVKKDIRSAYKEMADAKFAVAAGDIAWFDLRATASKL